MVYYRLKEKTAQYIKYEYFPCKSMKKEAGIIVVDIIKGSIDIEKMAEMDWLATLSIEEQNLLRNGVNDMRKEDGRAELTEEEWPSAKKEIKYAEYGSHAKSSIAKKINAGIIPDEDTVAWC